MTQIIYIAGIISIALLIIILVLVRKLNIKIKDISLKIDFFDQKLDPENKKILAIMNQQYSDILINIRSLNEKIKENEELEIAELYEKAKEIVRNHEVCSAGLLQRTLKIGYAKSARIIDMLEQNGIIGPADSMNPHRYIGE